MIKLPISEINDLPSVATFEPVQPNSVRTRLSDSELSNLPTNGHTMDSLREFAQISKHDDIDKIGIATRMLSESATKYSQSEFYSALLKKTQSLRKPK